MFAALAACAISIGLTAAGVGFDGLGDTVRGSAVFSITGQVVADLALCAVAVLDASLRSGRIGNASRGWRRRTVESSASRVMLAMFALCAIRIAGAAFGCGGFGDTTACRLGHTRENLCGAVRTCSLSGCAAFFCTLGGGSAALGAGHRIHFATFVLCAIAVLVASDGRWFDLDGRATALDAACSRGDACVQAALSAFAIAVFAAHAWLGWARRRYGLTFTTTFDHSCADHTTCPAAHGGLRRSETTDLCSFAIIVTGTLDRIHFFFGLYPAPCQSQKTHSHPTNNPTIRQHIHFSLLMSRPRLVFSFERALGQKQGQSSRSRKNCFPSNR